MIDLGLLFQKKIQDLHDNFAVAVSGGIDSMVLLHLSAQYCHQNIPIILTVNHRLRPEAEQEALFVFQHSQNLNLKCHILNWHGKLPVSNIQSVARQIRYRLLLQWCHENRINHLMIAHQKNDQAETIMLRLERGSGLDGLAGMQERTYLSNIHILRPLLDVSRKELLQYANKNNITWINDTSNNNAKYKRTLYRNMLEMTDNSEILINRLYTASMHIRRSLSCILHYVRLAINECLEFTTIGHINVKLIVFLTLPEEISLRLLTYSIMSIGKQKYKPRYAKLNNIFYKIQNNKSKISQTLCGCKITKHQNDIISITRETSAIQELTINSFANIVIEWDNRFKISVVNSSSHNVTVSSLNNNYIPKNLKKLNREAVRCLPTLKYKNKIVAYPLQNNSNNDYISEVKSSITIKEVLVKQNFINLTYSEFISKEPLL